MAVNFVPNMCPMCDAFLRPTFESTFFAGETYRCRSCGAYLFYVKTETLIEFAKENSDIEDFIE